MPSKQFYLRWAAIVFIPLVALWCFFLYKGAEKRQLEAFAQPLYTHALPAGAHLVQQDVARSKGVTTAALLLQADTTQGQLEQFYGGADYAPAREGEQVELAVKSLDGASLDALKQAGLWQEGGQYWFVYLTSRE